MLLPRRIRLLLAATLAASSLALVIAAYSSSGAKTESHATSPTLKSKILRRQDRLKENPNTYEKVLLRKHAAVHEERQVENKIPNHVPIKTRLKPDKEKKFKDVDNPEWYRDFELEVTNTSDKPIYYLDIWLVYPEIISDSGKRVGVVLRYGRMDFINFDTRSTPTDVPILPGATITLMIPEQDQKGWVARKNRERRPDPKKVEISLTQLSFGDGSGFNGSDAKPYPYKKEKASNRICEDSEEPRETGSKKQSRFLALSQTYSMQKPAELLPVSFFGERLRALNHDLSRGSVVQGQNATGKRILLIIARVGWHGALPQRVVQIRKADVQ